MGYSDVWIRNRKNDQPAIQQFAMEATVQFAMEATIHLAW